MRRETVSLRVTEREKQTLEKLGQGSISRGFREIMDNVDVNSLIDCREKGIDAAEQEILDIQATLDEYLKNEFFTQDKEIKRELARLQKDLERRKSNFVQNKLKGLKERLGNLNSFVS